MTHDREWLSLFEFRCNWWFNREHRKVSSVCWGRRCDLIESSKTTYCVNCEWLHGENIFSTLISKVKNELEGQMKNPWSPPKSVFNLLWTIQIFFAQNKKKYHLSGSTHRSVSKTGTDDWTKVCWGRSCDVTESSKTSYWVSGETCGENADLAAEEWEK